MAELVAPPVLSTPAENLFDQVSLPDESEMPRRSDEELRQVYEIARTAREVRAGQRRCVALQFPDAMLGDAPRVVRLLQAELAELAEAAGRRSPEDGPEEKVYILADTSYSACCVDEIAAEHADADVVVHYGRACLSPTSRLPVIYVFTAHPLDADRAAAAFAREFPSDQGDQAACRAVLMADVTYQDHLPAILSRLHAQGYAGVLSTAVVHNPLGSLPNRSLVDAQGVTLADDAVDLHDYAIFHVAAPPTSLLLALATKVRSFFVYPPETTASGPSSLTPPALLAPPTMGLLGRRYAKMLNMATAGIIGILVNTLSVSNYLSAVDGIRARIAAAGKKSYVVVVGKLNPVKLANFAEVEGWVVVGCWESSLVEDDAGFYQPVVTPFELELALQRDDERVWGLKWWGGLEGFAEAALPSQNGGDENGEDQKGQADQNGVSDDESEPPQFDLRTGKLVYHSRPMRMAVQSLTDGASQATDNNNNSSGPSSSGALTLRPKADVATINGVISPGAEFLRSQRTWRGLGTDFDHNDEDEDEEEPSTLVEEGRAGIARGYAVGDVAQRT